MSKMKDIQDGRNQGLALAYKILTEKGPEALREEIEYRNVSKVNLCIDHKELEEAKKVISVHATEVSILISLVAICRTFGISRFQAKKYKEVFDQVAMECCDNPKKIQENKEFIRDEYGIVCLIGGE